MAIKKIALAVVISSLFIFGSLSLSVADTLLFPVIAVNQPSVTTIVSVFNLPGTASTHLKYIYRSKESIVGGLPNHTGTCGTQSFTRNTNDADLVSFDASGVMNSGNALFNDPNTYNGTFDIGGSGARRAYLLVTNANSGGTRVNVGDNQALGGEAVIMDIASGAAWGYRAINDINREDYNFTKAGVGTAVQCGGTNSKWFSFFPTNEWKTRFFMTPIGDNMDSANLSSSAVLYGSGRGIYSRQGNYIGFDKEPNFTCTAGIDLTDMLDSTALSAVENIGGWAWLSTGCSTPSIIYKLEYVVNDPTYGGTNNNGFLLSTGDTAW
jgi:hypothetical protein